jgi:PTS system mannose-specific IIB component
VGGLLLFGSIDKNEKGMESVLVKEGEIKDMISLLRIDNRLIHGQVALVWTKYLGVNRIIVANDIIVKNEVQTATLKMACPSTAKCSILTVGDAINVLNDPRADDLKILIVVNNPTDARKIVEAVSGIPCVNISNYGHLDSDLSKRIKITDTVYVSDSDIEDFEQIYKAGKKCEYQVVPTNPAQNMYELINKAKK